MPQVDGMIRRFSDLANAEISEEMSEKQILDIERCQAVWDDIVSDKSCNVSWETQFDKKMEGVWYFAFNLDHPNLKYVGKTVQSIRTRWSRHLGVARDL